MSSPEVGMFARAQLNSGSAAIAYQSTAVFESFAFYDGIRTWPNAA